MMMMMMRLELCEKIHSVEVLTVDNFLASNFLRIQGY